MKWAGQWSGRGIERAGLASVAGDGISGRGLYPWRQTQGTIIGRNLGAVGVAKGMGVAEMSGRSCYQQAEFVSMGIE